MTKLLQWFVIVLVITSHVDYVAGIAHGKWGMFKCSHQGSLFTCTPVQTAPKYRLCNVIISYPVRGIEWCPETPFNRPAHAPSFGE